MMTLWFLKFYLETFTHFAVEIFEAMINEGGTQDEFESGIDRFRADVDHQGVVAKLLLGRAFKEVIPEFTALTDKEAVERLSTKARSGYAREQARQIVAKYRAQASKQGVPETSPLHYVAPKGFKLKGYSVSRFFYHGTHRDGNAIKEETTELCLASWIPRLVEGSENKHAGEQLVLLASLRNRMELPEHHLASFGSVTLLVGLIMGHFKATGEMLPFTDGYARTDTHYEVGRRLCLRWTMGVTCDAFYTDGPLHKTGVFALGVEVGKEEEQ